MGSGSQQGIAFAGLAAFCIVSFIEDSVYHRAAAAVDFFGCSSLATKNPFHAGMNLVVNSDFMMVVKYPLKERRDFLHDTLHLLL